MTEIPKFRVRVFLSVDLSGSTEYKARLKDNSWIRTFRQFYSQFLQIYRKSYTSYCEKNEECLKYAKEYPALWKTIGDEAIFVNRVESLFQLFAYLHSFDLALKEYKEVLKSKDETKSLDVKGNAWIAAFPFPNQTIPRPSPEAEDAASTLPDEAHEAQADAKPSDYDFLGPGIDAGFRISKNSAPDFMSLSPVLAYLAAHANNTHAYRKFSFNFRFSGTERLKGVLGGIEYPIAGLDTERNTKDAKLFKLKGQLTGANEFDAETLINYLETFIERYDIDCPKFNSPEAGFQFKAPSSYEDIFLPYWESLSKSLLESDRNIKESAKPSSDAEEVDKKNGDLTIHTEALIEELKKAVSENTKRRRGN